MHYVNARWLGGMLTNFRTIRKRIDRMAQLQNMKDNGTFELLPKKEVAKLELEMEKLDKYLGGVKNMKTLPKAMFIVDPMAGGGNLLNALAKDGNLSREDTAKLKYFNQANKYLLYKFSEVVEQIGALNSERAEQQKWSK